MNLHRVRKAKEINIQNNICITKVLGLGPDGVYIIHYPHLLFQNTLSIWTSELPFQTCFRSWTIHFVTSIATIGVTIALMTL